jgi:hypothetical protein
MDVRPVLEIITFSVKNPAAFFDSLIFREEKFNAMVCILSFNLRL